MSIELPPKCPRGRGDCQPLAQVVSDDETTFVCAGKNDGTTRTWPADRFRHCVKSSGQGPDSMQDCDERDMADQASVLVQALSIAANDRASAEASHDLAEACATPWEVHDRRRECVYLTIAQSAPEAVQNVQNDQWVESLDPQTVTDIPDLVPLASLGIVQTKEDIMAALTLSYTLTNTQLAAWLQRPGGSEASIDAQGLEVTLSRVAMAAFRHRVATVEGASDLCVGWPNSNPPAVQLVEPRGA